MRSDGGGRVNLYESQLQHQSIDITGLRPFNEAQPFRRADRPAEQTADGISNTPCIPRVLSAGETSPPNAIPERLALQSQVRLNVERRHGRLVARWITLHPMIS